MKKIFLLVLLVHFFPFSSSGTSASSFNSVFHENLPENRREEISILNEHSVKVGLGPDQQSVSCNILDAIGSIPSINGASEPDVVFVNKEKVHHIRKGLYTWDRGGKYRVRLTTKYIREFGDITIRVPDSTEEKSALEKMEDYATRVAPSYYQSLPENKREEITIIDPYMVEVGMGSDLRTVASNIQDAIQSIPAIEADTFPEFVFVNGQPIFFIGNGLYSWDAEGANPVRFTTPFIKKYGNIKVSIPGEEPLAPIEENALPPEEIKKKQAVVPSVKITEKQQPTIALNKKESPTTTAPVVKESPVVAHKQEIIARVQPPDTHPQQVSPTPSPPPARTKGLGLKGFRKAYFGMDRKQVKKVIRDDFHIDDSEMETFGREKNIIVIKTDKLSENGKTASVQYLFTNDKLVRVNVLWGPSEDTDHLAVKLVRQFLGLRFLKKQSLEDGEGQLYYGKDPQGNELKLSWAKQPNSNTSRWPLSLSYLAFTP